MSTYQCADLHKREFKLSSHGGKLDKRQLDGKMLLCRINHTPRKNEW
jgi:hypothetical protein